MPEHLHEENRWLDCARLFCHDPGKVGSEERIRIQECTADLYLYQAFGIFVMMEMEMFQKGGYDADDMGLEKVRIYAHSPCSESSSSFLPPSFSDSNGTGRPLKCSA